MMPALATAPQLKALRYLANRVIDWDYETDLPKMAAKMGFPVASLELLTRSQASQMMNRLDEINAASYRRKSTG